MSSRINLLICKQHQEKQKDACEALQKGSCEFLCL